MLDFLGYWENIPVKYFTFEVSKVLGRVSVVSEDALRNMSLILVTFEASNISGIVSEVSACIYSNIRSELELIYILSASEYQASNSGQFLVIIQTLFL